MSDGKASFTVDLGDPDTAANVAAAIGLRSVPVPVLEALLGAWEGGAERVDRMREEDAEPGDVLAPSRVSGTLRYCASQLREAIAHGGQG